MISEAESNVRDFLTFWEEGAHNFCVDFGDVAEFDCPGHDYLVAEYGKDGARSYILKVSELKEVLAELDALRELHRTADRTDEY